MAGFDFSQISDEQLEASVNALMHDPIALRSTSVAQRQATIDEYNRRNAARGAKPAAAATPPAAPMAATPVAPNVEANLEASASPIVPDPDPIVGTPRYTQTTPRDHVDRAREMMAENPGMSAKEAAALAAREQIRSQYKEMEENRPEGGYPMGKWGDDYYAATGAPSASAPDTPDGLVVSPEDVDAMSDDQIIYHMRNTGAGAGVSQYERHTPEQIATHRWWMKDVNRIPGGRDQERFNPKGYAAARQQYEQGIKDRANQQIVDEGMGVNRTPEQIAKRQTRMDSEAKMAGSDRRVDAMLARMAKRAGVSAEEARAAWDAAVADNGNGIKVDDGLTPDEIFKGTKALRDKATTRQASRQGAQQDKIALRREVRYNPVAALGDESGLNDWQKMVVADAMLRGGNRGPTPLGVDAAHNEQLTALGLRAVTGQGFKDATPEQRRLIEQQLREGDPVGAGVTDIASRNYERPEAQTEFVRLAQSLDTTAAGFSYDDERRLANALMQPPYNMPQADAEAYAYRYAEKRRWISGGKPYGAGAPQPAPKPDVQGIAPGSVPAV